MPRLALTNTCSINGQSTIWVSLKGILILNIACQWQLICASPNLCKGLLLTASTDGPHVAEAVGTCDNVQWIDDVQMISSTEIIATGTEETQQWSSSTAPSMGILCTGRWNT